jgi:hypothetical protein
VTGLSVVTQTIDNLLTAANANVMPKSRGSRFTTTETTVETLTSDEAAVDQVADGWRARWMLIEQNGTVIARSVHLEPVGRTTPPGGITTNLLRELSPSAAAVAAADRLTDDLNTGTFANLQLKWAKRDAHDFGPYDAGRRPGRPPLSDEHLRAVALAYLEELKRGRGVLHRLGERFDREPETMRDQVRIARRKGFLSAAPEAGRKGGRPGPRLARGSP